MAAVQLNPIIGWAAIVSAAATLGTLITGILFFAVNEKFGKANDILSVVQVVFMLPVAMAMYRLTRSGSRVLALTALAVGSIGMIIVAVLQILLVLRAVSFKLTIGAVLAAGAVIGIWLILANALALQAGPLPWGLIVFGVAGGVGYLLSAVGFYLGEQQHPLFYSGSALLVVGYVVWATWLGRLLQTSGV